MRDPSAKKPAERVAAQYRAHLILSCHRILPVLPETQMQVAARTGLAGVGLRHKCDAHAKAVRYVFETLLEDGVAIRHGQSIGVADVQFVLAFSPLALRAFHRDTGLGKMPAYR